MDNNSEIDYEALIYHWIQNNGDVFYNVSKRNKRRRENTVKDKPSLWESNWGALILDPRTRDPHSFMGKRFKRRFRVPFPIWVSTNLLIIGYPYVVGEILYRAALG